MNPLDQLSNMPKEPQLWDKEKKEQDNNDYQQPLNTSLSELKENLAQSLYWVKPIETVPDDENINNKEKKDIQELWNLEDSQIVPVLDWLLEQCHLDIEIYNDIIKKLQSSSKEEEIWVLEDSLSNIWSIDIKEKDKIIQNLKWVNEITEENFEKSDFFADFQNPENWSKPQWNDLDLLLAKNYIKLPNIDGNNYNKKSNLNITFNTVLNKIINKHSVDFKDHNSDIINEIRNSDNIWDKYISLQKLLKESKIEDSRWWKNQSELFQNGRNWVEKQNLSLEERFNKLKQEVKLAQQNNDVLRLQNLQTEIIDFKEEVPKWGALESWVMDLINETNDPLWEQA